MLQMLEHQRAARYADLMCKQQAVLKEMERFPHGDPTRHKLMKEVFKIAGESAPFKPPPEPHKPVVTVSNVCTITEYPEMAGYEIQKRLQVQNPKYANVQKYGKGGHWRIPELLSFSRVKFELLIIPRGCFRQALEILKKHGAQPILDDRRRSLDPIELNFNGQLRDYQQRAVDDVLARAFGVLSAATGSGKTIIALAVIAARQQPTLILVHTKELLDQWRDRIKTFLGIEAGVIGGGKFDLQPVTVGIVNSVKKNLENLPEHFGQVVVDECFPAGTTIMTCSGTKRIEQVRPGDIVKGYDHERKMVVDSEVKHLFKKNSDSFCRICLTDGQVIICTPDHPFWVDNAYLPARKLKAGQTVWRLKNARSLRDKPSNEKKKQGRCCPLCELREARQVSRKQTMADIFSSGKGREGMLQSGVCKHFEGQGLQAERDLSIRIQQNVWQNEQDSKQPNEKARCCKKNDQSKKAKWDLSKSPYEQRWERKRSNVITEDACRCFKLANRACSQNSTSFTSGDAKSIPKNARIPDMLQGRHCKSFAQNSRGSGWCKSQWTASDNGSEENGMLERVGVESVTLVQQANRGRFGGECEDGFVYNIETATGNYFAGGILVHNCHRAPSAMFTDAVRAFDCKHMLGLSATAYRRDGLDPLIYWTLGEKVHQVDPRELKQIGAVLTPKVIRRETAFQYQYQDDYPQMISTLTQDRTRNEQIAHDVIRQAQSRPGCCLVVSDRVQHCMVLAGLLEGHNLSIRVLTGRTKAKDRKAIVEAVQAGTVNVLVSTVQLLGEGFDCSGLSSLFLAAPMRFDGKITQVVGRILRPADGKRPVVFDYVDHNVGVLKGQSFHRARTLKELSA